MGESSINTAASPVLSLVIIMLDVRRGGLGSCSLFNNKYEAAKLKNKKAPGN